VESSSRPFVAVIGGLWQLKPERVAAAKAAANVIGEELAKAGFGLLVYFSNEESLEPHVVSGYISALGSGAGVIRVRYAESQRGQVRFAEEATRQELFEHLLFPGQDWEAPFYRSLAEDKGVEAVLLLGGAKSTLIAGLIAVARRLPILAVDEFGGSAGNIWNQLAHASPGNLQSWGTRPPAEFIARLKGQCEDLAAQRLALISREERLRSIDSQFRKIAYATGAFMSLLTTAFFGMVYTPNVSIYPFVMFAGLVAAGAGALVRAVLGTSNDIDPRTSLFLGAVAGFVVGLAYLIPQWVGAPGPLEPKSTAITAVDKIQFASAVLIAISAGVGFDTVFSRLQKQAQDVAITPPR
jgi:hypothetical protein